MTISDETVKNFFKMKYLILLVGRSLIFPEWNSFFHQWIKPLFFFNWRYSHFLWSNEKITLANFFFSVNSSGVTSKIIAYYVKAPVDVIRGHSFPSNYLAVIEPIPVDRFSHTKKNESSHSISFDRAANVEKVLLVKYAKVLMVTDSVRRISKSFNSNWMAIS